MDMVKIGQFLSELRKEQKLTQAQLGEKLGVTNKTVSRWETGTYMPPVEMLQLLSKLYGVSLNELLSGKRLSDTAYKEHAEENIKSVLKENSAFTLKEKIVFFKRKWKKNHLPAFMLSAFVFAAVMVCGIVLDNVLKFAAPVLAFLWYILQYNRMMVYVENHAYGAQNPEEKIKTP